MGTVHTEPFHEGTKMRFIQLLPLACLMFVGLCVARPEEASAEAAAAASVEEAEDKAEEVIEDVAENDSEASKEDGDVPVSSSEARVEKNAKPRVECPGSGDDEGSASEDDEGSTWDPLYGQLC